MKKVRATITEGKIHLDFDGFEGDACSSEEELIRLFLARMGVETDVEQSDNKRAPERNHIAEHEIEKT